MTCCLKETSSATVTSEPAYGPFPGADLGQDLSGSLQGAGGVGGLLIVSLNGTNCFPAFDGNGNVMSLVTASDGTIVAEYEYGPFGEVLKVDGDVAGDNAIRFSTKYEDESGLVYYGYRYYFPSLGRWGSRDPIEEQGGENLYGCIDNAVVNSIDLLGLADFTIIIGPDIFVPVDEKNNVWSGTGSPMWGGKASIGVVLNQVYSEFRRDKIRNPDGTECSLDIDWIESTQNKPMTLKSLRADLAARRADSLGIVVYLTHGILSDSVTKHPLVTEPRVSPDPKRGVGGQIVRGRLYSLQEIFGGATANAQDLRNIVVGSCNAEWVPDTFGGTKVYTLSPQDMRRTKVRFFDISPKLVDLMKSVCRRKCPQKTPAKP